jgi:hypothetical protein
MDITQQGGQAFPLCTTVLNNNTMVREYVEWALEIAKYQVDLLPAWIRPLEENPREG